MRDENEGAAESPSPDAPGQVMKEVNQGYLEMEIRKFRIVTH